MEHKLPRPAKVEIAPGHPLKKDGYRQMLRPGCGLILGLVAIAWLVELVDQVFGLFGLTIDAWGIAPRKLSGLPGVLFAPWLHGNWGHLISNTFSFVGLGFVMVVAEGNRFLRTTLILLLVTGVGTWLIGRGDSLHIGASGLIYGYFGYLLMRAWTERKLIWILVGIVIALVYGTMIWGVLPTDRQISWEGHLCGLLAGLWLGRTHGLHRDVQAQVALN